MVQGSGDAAFIDPNSSSKAADPQSSQSGGPAFPNTRWMNSPTDLSRNPGVFDDVFKKIKGETESASRNPHRRLSFSSDLMPPAFEGAKLSVTKMLSSHFQVSHSMTLSGGSNSGYKFGANYVGTQLYSPSEVGDMQQAE